MDASSEKSGATVTDAHSWIELISDPTLLCDADGIIQKANGHAREFFGVEDSQLSGVPVLWIIPTESRSRFLASWNRRSLPMCPCGPELPPITIRNSHGRPVSIWMTIEEIKSNGHTKFLMVFKNGSSSNSQNALDEAFVARHLSLVRHEIRSPLSGITVFTDVLLRNQAGNLDETQINHLTAIRNAAGDLASLVRDIEVPEVVPIARSA